MFSLLLLPDDTVFQLVQRESQPCFVKKVQRIKNHAYIKSIEPMNRNANSWDLTTLVREHQANHTVPPKSSDSKNRYTEMVQSAENGPAVGSNIPNSAPPPNMEIPPIVVPETTTVLVEEIPTATYAMWNTLARSHGATAVFTSDNASLCHFATPGIAFRFAAVLAAVTTTPKAVRMLPQSSQDYHGIAEQMRQNLAIYPRPFASYATRQV